MTISYYVMFDGKTICRPSFEVRDGASRQEIEAELEQQLQKRFSVDYIDPLYDERSIDNDSI